MKTTLVTNTPDITIAPRLLETTLNPGGIDTRLLTIGNVGRADLEWSLEEIPPVSWLGELPTGGTIAPPNSTDVVVTFTAPVTVDTYSTLLRITSNDPDEQLVPVAVVMTVTEECIGVTGADFEFMPSAPLVGQTITFTAAYVPSAATIPVTFTWNFGDETAETLTTNPVITYDYSDPISYTVVMTATNPCGEAFESKPVSVRSSEIKVYLPLVLRVS
jgi:PKD repeat protein